MHCSLWLINFFTEAYTAGRLCQTH